MFDLRSFIYLKNADIYDDFDSGFWVDDVAFCLYHKKDILITRKIMRFLFWYKYNIDTEEEFRKAMVEYKKILKEIHIHYTMVKINKKTLEEYPHANDPDVKELISVDKADFVRALSHIPNGLAIRCQLYLDDLVEEYREYVNNIEKEKMTRLIIMITKELCSKS